MLLVEKEIYKSSIYGLIHVLKPKLTNNTDFNSQFIIQFGNNE